VGVQFVSMRFRWTLAPSCALTGKLAANLKLPELLIQCLVNRGFSSPEAITAFLDPRLKCLSDPFLLPSMDLAVERIFQAIAKREQVVLFGDYDVDGVTSVAILLEVLQTFGCKVDAYLPNRLDEGYGLSAEAVENCLRRVPASLLIAVDCGSTASATISSLKSRAIDVIVLDHHQLGDPLPPAVALVNPRVALCGNVSPLTALGASVPTFENLCSAGLAFKLAHALVKRGRDKGLAAANVDVRELLDLVALGTIADLVPLHGENRILVSTGLKRLNMTARPGLVALKRVAQISGEIGVFEVAFQLAPRLNAAGRLENATAALQLVRAADPAEAERLARELDGQNRERQQIEATIVEQVIGAVRARFNPESDFVIVEGQLLWHIGVVGIVASRVLREFHRPTLIIGGEGDEWRGSGRSIEGFDLAAALRKCDDLLVRHGGHAMAAGLTVRGDKIDELRARLNQLARDTLTPELLQPSLRIDAEVSLADLSLEAVDQFRALEPIGQGNPGVQLVSRRLKFSRPPQRIGRECQHLKLFITDGKNKCDAIWWNGADKQIPTGDFDLAFAPQINDFNGRRTVQLKVLDLGPAV
jgi:single-stranded-DNA-specific exonuclease